MSEYKAYCGCSAHIAQWTTKRKLVSVKYCPKHSGEERDAALAEKKEALEMVMRLAVTESTVACTAPHDGCPICAGRALLRRNGMLGGGRVT